MTDYNPNPTSLLIHYLSIRKFLGGIAFLLPAVLAVGYMIGNHTTDLQPTISDYYHTNMRDIFVGLLVAISIFLFTYRGYANDHIYARIAGISVFFVAVLPVSPQQGATTVDRIVGGAHLMFAGIFFLMLAYFSIFLFTKSVSGKELSSKKRTENGIYRFCGYAILTMVAAIAVYKIFLDGRFASLDEIKPVFWLESSALLFFGFSWLAKGKALDKLIK